MLHRRFAAIKFWPGQKAAEDEVIERLKIAARLLDLECLVVDPWARLIHPPGTQLTQDDVDFVISLHFEAPKRFDIFSLVTLWNPLQFYYEWGYRKFTRNLLTHDDFLSTDSVSGDDHVMRPISNGPPRERPLFRFYPTLSGPLLEPTLGDKKLFYVGMNWEKTIKQAGRHDGLLGLLDEDGDLRLYGPKVYGGVEVWKDFKSYLGSIPFDGTSVVRLINQAGISLVLSSRAHAQSEMMSSRIFESSAAGAVIICNENPFARRHFGDSLLYIDTTLPVREAYDQVRSHLAWIKSEPDKALEMARRAQSIFRDNFRLDTCLERIYAGLEARKAQLASSYAPSRPEEKICVVFLMPEFHGEILEQHLASFQAQKFVSMRGVLAMDAKDVELFGTRVQCRLDRLPAPFAIAPTHFTERRSDGSVRHRRPLGEAIFELLRTQVEEDYVCIVAPGERLFSDHMSSLLRVLQDFPEVGCSFSDMLQPNNGKGENHGDLCDDPDVNSAEDQSIGWGRFLFRMSEIQTRVDIALPYLDTLAMRLLFGTSKSVPTRRCTILSVEADEAERPDEVLPLELQREILMDLSPQTFEKKKSKPAPEKPAQETPPPQSPVFSLAGMTPQERTQLAVDLAHSVPVPSSLKKLAFGAYRLWFRLVGGRAST